MNAGNPQLVHRILCVHYVLRTRKHRRGSQIDKKRTYPDEVLGCVVRYGPRLRNIHCDPFHNAERNGKCLTLRVRYANAAKVSRVDLSRWSLDDIWISRS
jgi:hypothetical protein